MVSSQRYTALLAAATALLPSVLALEAVPRQALQLEWCQERCVRNNGCDADSVECMCTESQDSFLEDMVQCMYQYCSGGVPFDELLTPLEAACKSMGKAIPQKSIDDAQKLMSFIETPSEQPSETGGNDDEPQPTTITSLGAPQQHTSAGEPAPTATATTTTTNTADKNDDDDGAKPTTTTALPEQDNTTGGWGPTKVVSTTGGSTLETAPTDPAVEENNNSSNGSPFGSNGSGSGSGSGDDDDEGAGHRQSASFAAIVFGLAAAVTLGW